MIILEPRIEILITFTALRNYYYFLILIGISFTSLILFYEIIMSLRKAKQLLEKKKQIETKPTPEDEEDDEEIAPVKKPIISFASFGTISSI